MNDLYVCARIIQIYTHYQSHTGCDAVHALILSMCVISCLDVITFERLCVRVCLVIDRPWKLSRHNTSRTHSVCLSITQALFIRHLEAQSLSAARQRWRQGGEKRVVSQSKNIKNGYLTKKQHISSTGNIRIIYINAQIFLYKTPL